MAAALFRRSVPASAAVRARIASLGAVGTGAALVSGASVVRFTALGRVGGTACFSAVTGSGAVAMTAGVGGATVRRAVGVGRGGFGLLCLTEEFTEEFSEHGTKRAPNCAIARL